MFIDDEQWCPNCHCLTIRKDCYWACPRCDYEFEDGYLDFGPGYPTYESTYEDDDEADEPECCRACGGPWPDCETSCKIFDD